MKAVSLRFKDLTQEQYMPIAAGDKTTSSILNSTNSNVFSTISPPSHTTTPRPVMSSPSFTITRLDCCDLQSCSYRSNRSSIDGNAFTSASAKIRLLPDFVPTDAASEGSGATSGTESIAESTTSYAHTTSFITSPDAPQHNPVVCSFNAHHILQIQQSTKPSLDIIHHRNCCFLHA
ncbi:uncharacterized protein MONOS_12726 [Monocercomonoides exilis]|uniref:uncharacterized protein n=1 Tax=Monocercomonoides exilis TaxID=2049356 RepID=UPI00355A8CDF|nr:hypothetical protein MONOS_12726 [Monocercomonoides exilis]|eukprot:MONOS_12726.1-p1 / transcript=MONOS_12726.1 / gene=MONOS_12726 / organism=Monocercomonoides_exilis_PA203 / gene_product=unspecified product / transcript_product=unspecified product / location=Mono_scaffold00725:7997-8659(-) / protein_length=177 / sequence_SO=supercontig / SO=protein_coding / is_pseudo=false